MKFTTCVVVGLSVAVMSIAVGLDYFSVKWWAFILAANVAFIAVSHP